MKKPNPYNLNIGDIVSFNKWIIQWADQRGYVPMAFVRAPLLSYSERDVSHPDMTLDFVRRAGWELTKLRPGRTKIQEEDCKAEWQATLLRNIEKSGVTLRRKKFLITGKNDAFINSINRFDSFVDTTRGHNFFEAVECDRKGNPRGPNALRIFFELSNNPVGLSEEQFTGIKPHSKATIGLIR